MSEIVTQARALVGSPYRHQGRGPYYDCLGVVIQSLRASGFDVIDRRDYDPDPGGELIPYLDAQFCRVLHPEPGDILAMRFARRPSHLAVWTGENLIHCHASVGRVVEHDMDRKWRGRLHSAWRAV